MTPAARLAAVIALLEETPSCSHLPADTILRHYLRQRRYIGSKDRNAISHLYFSYWRHKGKIDWLCNKLSITSPRMQAAMALYFSENNTAAEISTLFAENSAYAPPPLTETEQQDLQQLCLNAENIPQDIALECPENLLSLLKEHYGTGYIPLLQALQNEALPCIRVNTLKTTRADVQKSLAAEGIESAPSPLIATALRLTKRGAITNTTAFQQGWFEIQDESSQLACLLLAPKPFDSVLDYCAGAGGKTLAIAALSHAMGKIVAFDTTEQRLAEAKRRCERAHVTNVSFRAPLAAEKFTKVLVDAPCSGSGTWRRAPDTRWRYTLPDLQHFQRLQLEILQQAAQHVEKGGILQYCTCSIFALENNAVVQLFSEKNTDFHPIDMLSHARSQVFIEKGAQHNYIQFTPSIHECDGFFVAQWHKAA